MHHQPGAARDQWEMFQRRVARRETRRERMGEETKNGRQPERTQRTQRFLSFRFVRALGPLVSSPLVPSFSSLCPLCPRWFAPVPSPRPLFALRLCVQPRTRDGTGNSPFPSMLVACCQTPPSPFLTCSGVGREMRGRKHGNGARNGDGRGQEAIQRHGRLATLVEALPAGRARDDRPQSTTFAELFDAAVKRFAGQTAAAYFGANLSYRDLDRLSAQFANRLRLFGFQRGDRVLVVLPECAAIPDRPLRYPARGRRGRRDLAAARRTRDRATGPRRRGTDYRRPRSVLRQGRRADRARRWLSRSSSPRRMNSCPGTNACSTR